MGMQRRRAAWKGEMYARDLVLHLLEHGLRQTCLQSYAYLDDRSARASVVMSFIHVHLRH